MGMFNFLSLSSSQQSLQQELMIATLQKQLANTTWPTARNQLIAQINQQQITQQQIAQPQAQEPIQALGQTPSNQAPPQTPLRRQEIETELAIIKQAITRIENYIK